MNENFLKKIEYFGLIKSPAVWAAYFFGFLSAIITTVFASIAGPAFKIIQNGVPETGVRLSTDFGPIANLLLAGFKTDSISQKEFYWLFPLALFGLALAKFCFQWTHNWTSLYMGERVSHHVRQDVLRSFFSGKSANFSELSYQEKQQGVLQFFGREFRDVMNLIMNVYISMPIQIILGVLLLLLLVYISPMYLLIILGVAPLLALITRYFRKKIPGRQKVSLESANDTLGWLQKRMQGITTIKHHRTEALESTLFGQKLESLEKAEVRLARTESKLNPSIEFVSVVASAGLLGVVMLLKSSYQIDAEAFFSFMACLAILGQVFGKIARQYNHLLRAKVAVRRLQEAQNIFEQENSLKFYAKSETSNLSIENLSLATPTGTSIAEMLSAEFAPGCMHAILGVSGSGKSTLMRALAKVWPWVSKGRILAPENVSRIRFLPQKVVLGPLTLRDFLSGDKNDGDRSTLSKEEIEVMLKLAEADSLPNIGVALESKSYMVDIWEKSLSGGEHQRVALARIMRMLENTLVLVDEGFSALPPKQERRILEHMKKLVCPTSVYIFSMHNRANLEVFDHVWMLDKGELSLWKP